jgi:polyisoprenoid-binding protein YceI
MNVIAGLEFFSTTDTWYVDRERSSIGFRVRQRMIESVCGRFLDFDGMIEPGQPPTFVGSVRVASLATDHPERDELLRSTAFFDAERYPVMGFASTNIGLGDGGSLVVNGDLTIRGITRRVALDGTFRGTFVGRDGRQRLGFGLRGEVNRLDFDLSLNRATQGDSLIVANDIELILDIVVERTPLERGA